MTESMFLLFLSLAIFYYLCQKATGEGLISLWAALLSFVAMIVLLVLAFIRVFGG